MFAVLYWVCYNRFTSLIITVTSFRFAASEVNRRWTITCAETARLFFLPLNVEVLITPTNAFWPPAIKWHNIWWLSTIFTFVETKSLFINTVLDVTILTNSWKYIYKQFHFSKDIQLWPDFVFYEYNVRTLLLIYSESKKNMHRPGQDIWSCSCKISACSF